MRVVNLTNGVELASNARAARTFLSRLAGLLGRASLPPSEALLIEPCRSVHTLFMRYPIDVLYIDRSATVVKAVANMRPFRASVGSGAHAVIELPAGTIERTGTSVGHQLAIEP